MYICICTTTVCIRASERSPDYGEPGIVLTKMVKLWRCLVNKITICTDGIGFLYVYADRERVS